MTAIGSWLAQIGLEQHAALFEQNDIDLQVVAHLTDADLASLGLSLGHRRKILAAAARFRETPAAAEPPPSAAPPTAAQLERRQVTVLFADLVGSTAQAAALDPEEFSQLLRQFQNLCSERIAANEGYVAQLLGDGVLAYFGYPVASENSAECAVRTGIELTRAVQLLLHRQDGSAQQARVGIATGVVVVAELAGQDAHERTVTGDTPNMAARLQALAEPGQVLASEVTKHLTGQLFETEFRGVHDLKGFSNPVPVWRMVRELEVESRFAAVRAQAAFPMLGRELERDLLLHAWQGACAGRGHAVMLCGEAGMGKSRLLEVAAAQAQPTPHRLLRCQCSPYRRTTALYPIAQMLRRLADVRPERDGAANLDAIARLLVGVGLDTRHGRLLLAELLDVPVQDAISPMELTKAQKKSELLQLLARIVGGAAGALPTLLLVEDAHWIDPTTQQLLSTLVGKAESLPLLAVVTHRPEYAPPWADAPAATTLACKKLALDHCRSLVREIAAQSAIGAPVIEEIIRRSDGVPLFVEELTKAVIESRSVQTSAVPPTLRDSLMSRLDRLGNVKDIALVAAVIGRQFSVDLLGRLVDTGQPELLSALGRLCDSGLTFRIESDDDAATTYCFSHSLLQEAAYESLLKSRRFALHARVADLLTARDADPELVAFHRGRAAQPVLAAREWLRAAELAVPRSAHAEAMGCLDHALEEAARIEDPVERDRVRLDALLKRGTTNILQNGPLSPDAEAALTEAHEIASRLSLLRPLFQATWGLYLNAATSRRFDDADRHAGAVTRIAQELDDPQLLVEGLHHRWGIAYFRGDLAPMLESANTGARLYRRELHHHFANVFAGHDAGVCAHYCAACGVNLLGRYAEAVKLVEGGIALAESLEHPMTIQFSYGSATSVHFVAGNWDAAADCAAHHRAFALRYGMAAVVPSADFFEAAVQLERRDATALKALETNLAGALRYGFHALMPHAAYAKGLVSVGRAAEGLAHLDGVLTTTAHPEVGMFMPELWRVRGLAALAASRENTPVAREHLRVALRIATGQNATLLRLRAASDLAQLLAGEGGRADARGVLREVLDSIDESCESRERAEAAQLASQLD